MTMSDILIFLSAKFDMCCPCDLTTVSKPTSREVSTNDGIITQNIFNSAFATSSERKENTEKLYFCEYLMSTRYLLRQGYQT